MEVLHVNLQGNAKVLWKCSEKCQFVVPICNPGWENATLAIGFQFFKLELGLQLNNSRAESPPKPLLRH
jgi:hypothetical protein